MFIGFVQKASKIIELGFYFENETVILSRFLARKEIYKNFP